MVNEKTRLLQEERESFVFKRELLDSEFNDGHVIPPVSSRSRSDSDQSESSICAYTDREFPRDFTLAITNPAWNRKYSFVLIMTLIMSALLAYSSNDLSNSYTFFGYIGETDMGEKYELSTNSNLRHRNAVMDPKVKDILNKTVM